MPISVTVKTLDSRNHEIEGLDDEITVLAFKEKIAATVGVAANLQRLIHCGRVLRDEKKLSEYGVNGKVIHLVQRNPNAPTDGSDPVSASEARAREASPARGRTHHHHIRIQQQPGYIPSMTFRLNIARELLNRANRTIARLENPNAPPPADPAPAPAANIGVAAHAMGGDMGPIPQQVAQAIQSAVNNAVQSMASGAVGGRPLQTGHFEMSVSIDQNGQILSQSGPSRQQQQSSQQNGAATDATNASPAAASTPQPPPTTTASTASSTPSSGGGSNTARQLQHPPLSELADAMDELQRTEERFQPFRRQINELLRNDPTFESDIARQEAQHLFNRSTEVMHLLSHVQHALSDAVVNLSQPVPRHIRASPLVIQSRSTYIQSGPIAAAAAGLASPMRASSASRPSSSQATTAPSAPSNSTATATPMETEAPAAAAAHAASHAAAHAAAVAGQAIGQVEVNVEPIIVGIEMEPTEVTIGGMRAPTANGAAVPQEFLHLMQSMMHRAAHQAASSTASSSSVGGTASSGSSSQDSQARSGSQTQPTTSTQTRSSAHVHYAPRGPLGLNMSPFMMGQPTFDPLLPCNSHHIATNLNRRTRHPAGHLIPQRPRSASVPPRGGNAASANQSQEGASRADPQASSARSSPQRTPRHQRLFPNMDVEMSTHIDVLPMIMTPQGVMSFGTASTSRQGQSAGSTSSPGPESVEPSLAAILGNVQSNDTNNSYLGVVRGIMSEIGIAMNANQNASSSSGNERTIGDYLESLPDYTYVEGESLITDLLMLVARNTTFYSLVNILMGASDSFRDLHGPLQQFLRRYVLTPPNDDEQHDIDAAVLHLVDVYYPQLEEMASTASVRPDIDFAETLHSFMAANLSSLAETILRSPTHEEFSVRFREQGNTFLTRLIILCLRCLADGNVSLERIVRNRVEAMGDVGPEFRRWIMSTVLGHLRNYVAGINVSAHPNEDIEQYFVKVGPDSQQRKAARKRRLQQHQTREDETFVTPRSSPPRTSPTSMEVDDATMPQMLPPPPPVPPAVDPSARQFPASLLSVGSIDSTLSIGSQGWHGTVPSSWVPIVSRDVSRQSGQEDQRPFSDAYVSTQSAKRRRLAAKSKPEGSAQQVIADTLETAIKTSGVQPVNPVEEVVRETSSQPSLQESLQHNFRTNVRRRIKNDPDYDSRKFPSSQDFANNPK